MCDADTTQVFLPWFIKWCRINASVLESASSELLALSSEIKTRLGEHSEQTESKLSDIRDSVESKKETGNTIEGLAHSCGGSGWRQVTFLTLEAVIFHVQWNLRDLIPAQGKQLLQELVIPSHSQLMAHTAECVDALLKLISLELHT